MKKSLKHRNIMTQKSSEGCSSIQFVCRGCTIRNREQMWFNFLSSVPNVIDRKTDDNSYLFLEEEPNNEYDPNAIKVVCGGEFFGTLGYVGKEFTLKIKDILNTCSAYRIDMLDENTVQKEITLILTYKENNNGL